MRLLDSLRRSSAPSQERSFSFQDWVNMFTFGGNTYGTMTGSAPDKIDGNFTGYIDGIHRRNGVVSAAVVARSLLISQLRFMWRDGVAGDSPGRLWGSSDLDVLERPGSMTRPELLFAMEHDVSYAGTSYLVRSAGAIRRLRPDWVGIGRRLG
jgi:hypothetical protein